MMLEFVISKGLSAFLVLSFFVGIALFLRFLYGPGGRFRDPEWDRWNAESERERAESGLAELESAFSAYARGFFCGDDDCDRHQALKLEHSLRVLGYARELGESEAAFGKTDGRRALLLAALLHDAGRFMQYRRYKTYADALSRNHAALGVKAIRDAGFLAREPVYLRNIVYKAVAAHNQLKVPAACTGVVRDVLLGLRDADKLDILRVMAEQLAPGGEKDGAVLLHLEDRPGAYTEIVAQALFDRESALYRDMRFFNDFRLLLCTWVFELNFASSRSIARREGYLARVIAGMEGIPELQQRAKAIVDGVLDAEVG